MQAWERIHINWEIKGKPVLMLTFHASGALNRMGDGSGDKAVSRLCMGHGDPAWFTILLQELGEDALDLVGRYEFPDPQGDKAVLSIVLSKEEEETGFEFTYGTESVGPPEEMVNWVELAVNLSHDWWEEQLFKGKQRRKK
ncbi:MAG: hypothetical protein AAFP92_05820 [Bacteroidota bacterium]